MTNPYVSRGPLHDPNLFFGRTHELDEIAAFLRGNQSVSVVGPRKIGKTSLLFHLIRPETRTRLGLAEGYLFAYLDCEVLGEGDHATIFGQFAGEMAAALDENRLPPEPALEAAIVNPSRLSFERAVRRLNQRDLRVVLILDEFERLSTNASLNVNFFNALRSAAGRFQLAFITASARPLIQLTYSGRSQEILSSPFFNIFAPLFLGLMPEGEARQLIEEPAQRAAPSGVKFPAEIVGFIYDLAGGHPLALQVACFHTFEVSGGAGERRGGGVEKQEGGEQKIWGEIERRTTEELAAHFQYYWHNLSLAEQGALKRVTELAARAPGDTTLRSILRDLVQKCLLVSDGRTYRYPSRAWAAFVSAQEIALPNLTHTGGLVGGLSTLTGVRLGPYEVLESLGRGGMSEVYKGRHTRLERTVAIKVLSASLASEADFRTRFEREARAIASLRHPNIVQVYDFGDLEGTYFMVMEFIAGTDLARRMNEMGRMPLDLVRAILADLASALDYAHAQGLVHRDVKPSNVLLERSDARSVLTDFGIAKILGGDTGATRTGLMMGTLNYMAPEQIRSAGEVDGRADVYAVGVMVYQMLTGQLPFIADNPATMILAHLQWPPTDPREILPDLPAPVAHALLRALEKEPAERFRTVGELARALA